MRWSVPDAVCAVSWNDACISWHAVWIHIVYTCSTTNDSNIRLHRHLLVMRSVRMASCLSDFPPAAPI